MNTSVDTYNDHAGSVRGVDFHQSQPLFVTGADDTTVKVWNHKLRRCLFTLNGHMDYVRTTFFHHEQPWIVSASDDFTIRIWNWQSRKSICCLPGHNHYVMCAQFHPREDMVISGSLDRTVRVWNISALRSRKDEGGITQDLLSSTDVAVRFQVEAHEKGINWVEFNRAGNLFLSAADDRTIRVWDFMGSLCYEKATLRGHSNNVCCAKFFKQDFVISAGEDRTIRVFSFLSGNSLMVFRRDVERYWILAVDPERNLIAAGHDAGLQVFKLFRERPASTITGNKLLTYVAENAINTYDFETKVTRKSDLSGNLYPPITISRNPADDQVALYYANDGGSTELRPVDRPGTSGSGASVRKKAEKDAVFFGPNKYAYIDGAGALFMCNLQSEKDKQLETTFTCSRIFPGPMGCILCVSEDKVYMYQVAQHGAVAETTASGVKYVVWDKDFSKLALISKNTITVVTKRLKPITTVSESTVRIKSVAFDETRDVIYFTTSNHLKYCNLRNGECSTISTLKNIVYLVRAVGDTIWVVTRRGKVIVKELDNLELNFKLKLHQQSYRDLIKIIKRRELKGQALVGYLHKHGHSEIALHFVSDPLTRFNLAVECGAMDIAKSTAVELNQPAIWRRLAETATRFGDIQLSQFASAKAGNYYTSALLALITGNTGSVGSILEQTNDDNFKLHYGLYLDDVQQRVSILCNANQFPLAYVTAKSHGLEELADSILSKMDPEVAARAKSQAYRAPCAPMTAAPVTDNWPMLQVEESVFSRLLREPGQLDAYAEPELEEEAEGAGWDDDDGNDNLMAPDEENDGEGHGNEGGGWDDDLDIDVTAALQSAGGTGTGGSAAYVVPREYPPLTQTWADMYTFPSFHVASGSFVTALQLLQRQIGLKDPVPLKPHMMNLWASVNSCRPSPLGPSSVFPLSTLPPADEMNARHAPAIPDMMSTLAENLRVGYRLFVEGKFADSLAAFETLLQQAVFTVVKDDQQQATLREIMAVAPEYARALALQVHLRTMDPASTESLEMALYFTHFKLHRPHLTLALTQAMSKAYKKKNIKTAADVAVRLLQQDPPKNKADQAQAIIAEADRNPTDAVPLDYDSRSPFVMCSVSLKPMFKGVTEPTRCSYCLSPASVEYTGTLCPICKIATIGLDSAGLTNRI